MEQLPTELITAIALNLDLRSLGRLTRTNRKTNITTKSKIFWKFYFERYYPYWFPQGDIQEDCKTMPFTWVTSGMNIITKQRGTLTTSIEFSDKTFAYDGVNRFGILGGHGAPLMSFRLNEDLTFSPLDIYRLPDSPEYRYKTLTPTHICLDDRFIVVGMATTGSIIVFNKQTGAIFSQFEDDFKGWGNPISELYFDRDKLFYAKTDGSIQLLDFETGQKINQHATELEYIVCTYDSKSHLCFYGDMFPDTISMIDFRISPTKVCTSWEVPELMGNLYTMKYYDNELYCGSRGGPLVYNLLSDDAAPFPRQGGYKNCVTLHVDADRVLLGHDDGFNLYDRRDRTKSCTIPISDRKDVLQYFFEDSYFIACQSHFTSVYSVADLGRASNVPDKLLAKSLNFHIDI